LKLTPKFGRCFLIYVATSFRMNLLAAKFNADYGYIRQAFGQLA
jgi:hypothetical protein